MKSTLAFLTFLATTPIEATKDQKSTDLATLTSSGTTTATNQPPHSTSEKSNAPRVSQRSQVSTQEIAVLAVTALAITGILTWQFYNNLTSRNPEELP